MTRVLCVSSGKAQSWILLRYEFFVCCCCHPLTVSLRNSRYPHVQNIFGASPISNQSTLKFLIEASRQVCEIFLRKLSLNPGPLNINHIATDIIVITFHKSEREFNWKLILTKPSSFIKMYTRKPSLSSRTRLKSFCLISWDAALNPPESSRYDGAFSFTSQFFYAFLTRVLFRQALVCFLFNSILVSFCGQLRCWKF